MNEGNAVTLHQASLAARYAHFESVWRKNFEAVAKVAHVQRMASEALARRKREAEAERITERYRQGDSVPPVQAHEAAADVGSDTSVCLDFDHGTGGGRRVRTFYPLEDSGPWQDIALRAWEDG